MRLGSTLAQSNDQLSGSKETVRLLMQINLLSQMQMKSWVRFFEVHKTFLEF